MSESIQTPFQDFFDTPEGLADRIAEVLGFPVTIEDANHRIVSYSKHEKHVDDARSATIMQRKVPDHVVNGLWKQGVMSQLFETSEPIIVDSIEHIGLSNRLAIAVRKHNDILGFIWAQSNDTPVTPEHLQQMKDAAQMVSQHLLRQQAKKRKTEENQKEFFWQLLSGTLRHESEILHHAKRFDLQLAGPLCVVVFAFPEDMSHSIERHANYLTKTMHQSKVISRLFDDNQLVLLLNTKDTLHAPTVVQGFIRDFIQKMKERFVMEEMAGVYGLLYRSPEYIRDSYRQALKVLELKEQFPHPLADVTGYEELGVYQFINELAALQKREQYRNEKLERIKQYDIDNRTSLYETLKTFLMQNSNVHQAAAQMHIHTNTLNYRLKRIKEIGNIDFKNPNQKTMLYLDILTEQTE